MEDIRGTLVILCVIFAVALAALALWKSSRHSRNGRLPAIYAALFALLGFVLWRRGAELPLQLPNGGGDASQSETSIDSAGAPVPKTAISATESLGQAARLDSSRIQQPNVAGDLNTAPSSTSGSISNRPNAQSSIAEAEYREFERPNRSDETLPQPARSVDQGPIVEDQIESAVVFAFDVVENFFMKYGWSEQRFEHRALAPVPSAIRAANHSMVTSPEQISFPSVSFYGGTAELTGESQENLRELAVALVARPDVGILEINARVDSVGPEAFNYILTQARAAVVRDYLVGEGVPSDRLIARGLGSVDTEYGSEPAPIEFVVRR